MSWDEFQTWVAYRAKRGSLNVGYRAEVAAARICALYMNMKRTDAAAQKWYVEDFAPHMDERVITLEELAEQMGSM